MKKDLDAMLASEAGRIYDAVMKSRKDDDYVVNPEQMDKLIDLVQFFDRKFIGKETAHVQTEKFQPRVSSGSVIADFVLFDVTGDEVQKFCEVLGSCSNIQVMLGEGCVIMTCTVPNVFVRKE